MKFKVVLRKDKEDGGYVARCPALKGCVSQGETKAEALANIREAIEGVVLVLNERARKTATSDQLVEIEV
ncbi:MAG: type II toxin-antitoxin system HicB family antitoxin [Methanobacteriota archaeon]